MHPSLMPVDFSAIDVLVLGGGNAALFDPAQAGLANALIALLLLSSLTGLLLALRATPAMAPLLIVHLAVVLTLFLTVPYGKFVHGFYRLLAILNSALEKRRPVTIVGGEG